MSREQDLKFKLINAILPDSVFRLTGGGIDQESLDELIEKYEELEDKEVDVEIKLPSVSGLLKRLIPAIPEKVVPSPADIREYADRKVSEIKYNTQKNITERHVTEATKAEQAFTQRKTKRSVIRNPLTR